MAEPLEDERLWEITAEHSPVGMTLVRPDGVVLTANRALCTMLRCDESDLLGSRYVLLTHPDDRARHVALFDEAVAGERDSYRLTKRCLRRDGSVLWGDLSAAALRVRDGETRYLIGQLVDVTQQREHEERLAEALETIEPAATAGPGDPRHRRRGAADDRRRRHLRGVQPAAHRLPAARLPRGPRRSRRSARCRLRPRRCHPADPRGDAVDTGGAGRGVRRPSDVGRRRSLGASGALGLGADPRRLRRGVRGRGTGLQRHHRPDARHPGARRLPRIGLPRAAHAAGVGRSATSSCWPTAPGSGG